MDLRDNNLNDYDWNVEHWDEIPAKSKNERLPKGVTQEMFWDAIQDNRNRVRNLLGVYDSWTDDVMCELAEKALNALPRWVGYEHRGKLAAFVNFLAKSTVNEWLDRDRPKHRGGMTFSPKRDSKKIPMPNDPGNADAVREWLSATSRKDQANRFDIGDDINSQYGPDGRLKAAPTDRLDYETWKTEDMGERDEKQADQSDLTPKYDREFKALRDAIRIEYRTRDAWEAVWKLALKDNRPDSDSELIRQEIRKWILDCHKSGGSIPSIDSFPIITRTARRAADRRNNGRRHVPRH
ncbi:hypothetical protein CSQ85_11725 [Bifidobacterium rousetti]|nr:hypothetical protein CSQ85_11725 [Bifidobacterium rousetti]